MKKLIKQLASESLIYGLSGIVTKFINVFLVPLYTRVLSPEDYGVLNLINTSFYFITIFTVFALDNSASRWYFDTDVEQERKKPIASWFWFQLVCSVLLVVAIIPFSGPLSKLITSKDAPVLFIIPALNLLSAILPTIIWNWLRLQRRVWTTVAVSGGAVLLTILLNILFVVVFKMGIKGILLANLASNLVYSIIAAFLMGDWINPKYFSRPILTQMLKYSLPLLPSAVAFWVLGSSGAYFIKHFATEHEVGLFSIASGVASIVGMCLGAFQMAWSPFAMSIMNKPEAKEVYAFVLTGYTFFASTVALTVALFAREALMVLATPEFYAADVTSGILAFNTMIYGYVYIAVIGTQIVKKTSPLAIGIIVASLITAAFYFLLVPVFGKIGAALGMMAGYLFIPVFVFQRAQKVWAIPYRFGPTVLILFAAGALFLLSISLPQLAVGYTVAIKIALLLSFLLVSAAIIAAVYKSQLQAYRHRYNLRFLNFLK